MTTPQRTIERPQEVSGFGLFGGIDVTLRFLPAPEDHGLVFERVDLDGLTLIPALIENVIAQPRRTVLGHQGATVGTVEHVLAALAGLRIDNCLIQVNAPECPGCDGSALPFAEALFQAGIIEQSAPAHFQAPTAEWSVTDRTGGVVTVWPGNVVGDPEYRVRYELDYGIPEIPAQVAEFTITPETFGREIAFARTFVLESEVAALRNLGFGLRVTPQHLLVFGKRGVIGNSLRCDNECARHKLLDCLGDFALSGTRLSGRYVAHKSGHHTNHEVVRQLAASEHSEQTRIRAA